MPIFLLFYRKEGFHHLDYSFRKIREIITLPEEMIKSYQFKKHLFIGYKLCFVLTDGRELDFNINKMMIGRLA